LTTAGRARAGQALATISISLLISIAALFACAAAARADAPDNDAFADAIFLPAELPAEKEGTNFEATKEAGEPNHAGDPGGHSVWYRWTPTSSGPIGIQSGCFNESSALIAVYTGSGVDSLTPVASNETPSAPFCFFSELPEATFEASAGTTYWIAVDGRNGAQNAFNLKFNRPPANDDFAGATALAAAPPESVLGTNRLASKQAGEPDHAGDPGGHSVWYSWTPTSNGPVAISTCSPFGVIDSVLAVYTGSSLGALTPVAENDDGFDLDPFPGCRYTDSEVVIDAVAGTTYRIAVDGANGTTGRFNLRIQGRPQNDDFASPEVLNPNLPGFRQGRNRFATKETGEPSHAGNAGGGSVWFSWTPSSSGPVAISTCTHFGNDLDTLLAVYTGSGVDSLAPVASGDDGARICSDSDSEVRFSVTTGTTYRIAVDGKDGSRGRFDLNLEGPPANDDFAAAKTVSAGLPANDFGSTRLGSEEAGEPDHAGDPGGSSVWFSWTATSSGPVAISVCPYGETGPDTLLAVYTGSSLGALTPVAGNDDSPAACWDVGSEVEIDAVAGTTYRIAVDGKDGSEGVFSLELSTRAANDDFAAAAELPAFPMMAGGSTKFASKEAGEPNHAGDPGGHSLWFSWTPSESGPMDISACGVNPGVDTLLAVYTGSGVGALTPVASSDDVTAKSPDERCDLSTDSEVVFEAVAGTTYRIAVDTKNGEGRFNLGFMPAPANDDFAKPSVLSGSLPLYSAPLNKLADKEAGEPSHAGNPGGHSVWYSWTPTKTQSMALSTCTHYGDLDALVAVYTGSTLGGLTPVAVDDDGSTEKGCRSTDSEAEFTALAGTTYRIAVDGKDGTTGSLQLILEGVTPHDDFGQAQQLGGLPTQGFSSNRFATKQGEEPNHAGNPGGASVWFKWTAPRDGEVSVDTCDSSFDTLLAVYTGGSLGALTPVQSNDDGSGKCGPQSRLTFQAVANTVYRIAVDGKGGATGPIRLHLEDRPEHDDFGQATLIPAGTGWWMPGSTVLATKQPGEPNHGGDTGGHSVWYSWTPSKSVEVEIDACSSSFDPVLAVYEGAELDQLTPVATSDAGTGECGEGRSVFLEAHSDVTYRIAVDGEAGDSGHFELHLRPVDAIRHALSIGVAGGGSGSVTSSRTGIDCGSTCSREFQEGSTVTLLASPAAGSTFAGWSGGCSGTGSCQVTLKSDVAVTATFAPISSGGGGSTPPPVTPSPPPPTASPPPPVSKPQPKPKRCKRGFKKKIVKGKARCVKKKQHRRHR
jgi:Divergent InlB B-repeat domain